MRTGPTSWLVLALFAMAAWAAGAVQPRAADKPDAAATATSTSGSSARPVIMTTVDGAISPASADQILRALSVAEERRAQLFVLRLDTPGGLDISMRHIIKAILASPVPVATFVAPGGARAASAGTYILYASHVAAMAPASNLGAATPVSIGLGGESGSPPPAASGAAPSHADTMTAKRLSDASAYIRSLAQLRGRNAQWAEKAVRESVSLSAAEALKLHVIDVVADDVPDLLQKLDGRRIEVADHATVQLATRGVAAVEIEPGWRTRVLTVIADPSLALVLMMIGIYGLLFEFMNPGYVLPGVVGAISLLLGLFALQMLPVNYAGLALILLGIAFLVAEAFIPSFGALGLGGVIAFAIGALMLVDSGVPGLGIPRALIALLTLTSAGFVLGVAGMAAKARRRPVVSGAPAMVGTRGSIVEFSAGEGWALVNGENWRVRGDAQLERGQRIRVMGVDGLTLRVAADDEGATPQGA